MMLHEKQTKIDFVLNNSLRFSIIELLMSHMALSSTEIATLLPISLDKCCYYLDNLNDLIEKDEEERYLLNNNGLHDYNLIVQKKNIIFTPV